MSISTLSERRVRASLAWHLKVGLAACLGIAGATGTAAAPSDDRLDQLVAAERRFAADVLKMGLGPGFRAHAAPDSISLRAEPIPALPQIPQAPEEPPTKLEWYPAMGAVARSNDLGFTTGPYRMQRGAEALRGQFLTIWERGEDGRWRWYLDHGLPPVAEQQAAPLIGTVRNLGGRTGGGGLIQLAEAEEGLNKSVAAGDWATLLNVLVDDGFLLRPRLGMLSRAQAAQQLAGRPGFASVERLGMRLARSGDLAISYGRLKRYSDSPSIYYVRVWRREPASWRLLVDEIA